jgi:predicted RNA binding protein YcfA (HicA-like mRNA interferase family)
MTGVEMIKLLRECGHREFKIKGSHYHFRINGKNVQVPHHHQEMGKGLENYILKLANITRR